MKGRPKKCCKCGAIVAELIPDGSLGMIPLSKVKRIKPFVIKSGKYWCKECADKEEQ